MKPTKKAKKKTPKLSIEEKRERRLQSNHKKLIRTTFDAFGFSRSKSVADKEFTYDGATSDFDDVFIRDNVIILVEYTTSGESKVSEHLKKKHILYQKITANASAFFDFLKKNFAGFSGEVDSTYLPHQIRIRILYCSLNPVSSTTKNLVPDPYYYDYNVAKYFRATSLATRQSGRFEVFEFLNLKSDEIGDRVKTKSVSSDRFSGSVLPEGHSNFGTGFKVVSFYANPKAILSRSYVLRRGGWRDGGAAYQRMIDVSKILNIRKYLKEERRVFINNIIVTLPADTKIVDDEGNTIKPDSVQDTSPANIQLTSDFNSIGLIDGQHRVMSYHEGGIFDEEISVMRDQQNLLITGIVFPVGMSDLDKLKFEAKVFLEINSQQTRVRSDIRQEINALLSPFSSEAIAKLVMRMLNDEHGPLRDHFERFTFEKNKVKTASIVSFGLRPLVSPTAEAGLFKLWDAGKQAKLLEGRDVALLNEYAAFCRTEINALFSSVRHRLTSTRWTADRSVEGSFLNTTNINGVIALLRRITKTGKLHDFEYYSGKLEDLDSFVFNFKSSQYGSLGDHLFDSFFAEE
ncbi:DGQHR domain-containing protein [Fuscovulum blasticum]|uniref:DGQHR domain-containing protein n=1 Tax=Fuscovulum blasticum TaxID=1075 RepID=UPI0013DE84A9|nr:DGQHR domain-containing protein [Fuscovulum blasticum]